MRKLTKSSKNTHLEQSEVNKTLVNAHPEKSEVNKTFANEEICKMRNAHLEKATVDKTLANEEVDKTIEKAQVETKGTPDKTKMASKRRPGQGARQRRARRERKILTSKTPEKRLLAMARTAVAEDTAQIDSSHGPLLEPDGIDDALRSSHGPLPEPDSDDDTLRAYHGPLLEPGSHDDALRFLKLLVLRASHGPLPEPDAIDDALRFFRKQLYEPDGTANVSEPLMENQDVRPWLTRMWRKLYNPGTPKPQNSNGNPPFEHNDGRSL